MIFNHLVDLFVPRPGIEPGWVSPLVFETSASTYSAIWATLLFSSAKVGIFIKPAKKMSHFSAKFAFYGGKDRNLLCFYFFLRNFTRINSSLPKKETKANIDGNTPKKHISQRVQELYAASTSCYTWLVWLHPRGHRSATPSESILIRTKAG